MNYATDGEPAVFPVVPPQTIDLPVYPTLFDEPRPCLPDFLAIIRVDGGRPALSRFLRRLPGHLRPCRDVDIPIHHSARPHDVGSRFYQPAVSLLASSELLLDRLTLGDIFRGNHNAADCAIQHPQCRYEIQKHGAASWKPGICNLKSEICSSTQPPLLVPSIPVLSSPFADLSTLLSSGADRAAGMRDGK